LESVTVVSLKQKVTLGHRQYEGTSYSGKSLGKTVSEKNATLILCVKQLA